MFCEKCGSENTENAKYCRKCGAFLGGTDTGRSHIKRYILAGIALMIIVLVPITVLFQRQKVQSGEQRSEEQYGMNSQTKKAGQSVKEKGKDKKADKSDENTVVGATTAEVPDITANAGAGDPKEEVSKTVPEEMIPEESIPEELLPEEAIPEEAIPEAAELTVLPDGLPEIWTIDPIRTNAENTESLTNIFGRALNSYGSELTIDQTDNITYYIGAGIGGTGVYSYMDGIIQAEINPYEGDTVENYSIEVLQETEQVYLVMDFDNMGEAYKIYWCPK